MQVFLFYSFTNLQNFIYIIITRYFLHALLIVVIYACMYVRASEQNRYLLTFILSTPRKGKPKFTISEINSRSIKILMCILKMATEDWCNVIVLVVIS